MAKYFWVTGVDTDVGKTLVTTYFLRYFQEQGERAVPYKPIQTGMVIEESRSYYSDTEFYKSNSKTFLVEEHLNTYSFKEPASPHYAAMLEGADIDKDVVLQHMAFLKTKYDCVICEGAGGLYVPLDEQRNYYFLDLIEESQLPVVLVARTTLGTINHTLLSLEALKMRGIPIGGIVFNRFKGTQLELSNIETIRRDTGLPAITIPELNKTTGIAELQTNLGQFFERLMTL